MAQVPDRITITFDYFSYPKPAAAPTGNFDAATTLNGYLNSLGLPANLFNGNVKLDSSTLIPASDPQPSNPAATVTVVITDATSIDTFVNNQIYLAD